MRENIRYSKNPTMGTMETRMDHGNFASHVMSRFMISSSVNIITAVETMLITR